MRKTHLRVANKFRNGQTYSLPESEAMDGSGPVSRMQTDGQVIYSYGEHYPIAVWLDQQRTMAVYCDDYWSSCTSRQVAAVLSVLKSEGVWLTRVSLDAIKKIRDLRYEDRSATIAIVKMPEYQEAHDFMERHIDE